MSPLVAAAQPQRQPHDGAQFDPQKFQQMVEQTLTKAGGLTTAEAEAFFPLYNEMRAKQREIGRQIHDLKQSTPTSSKAYADTILRIKKLQLEMAELEQEYYKRILRKVSAEKVFKMMQAEDDFHRRMVRRNRDSSREKKGRHHNGSQPLERK